MKKRLVSLMLVAMSVLAVGCGSTKATDKVAEETVEETVVEEVAEEEPEEEAADVVVEAYSDPVYADVIKMAKKYASYQEEVQENVETTEDGSFSFDFLEDNTGTYTRDNVWRLSQIVENYKTDREAMPGYYAECVIDIKDRSGEETKTLHAKKTYGEREGRGSFPTLTMTEGLFTAAEDQSQFNMTALDQLADDIFESVVSTNGVYRAVNGAEDISERVTCDKKGDEATEVNIALYSDENHLIKWDYVKQIRDLIVKQLPKAKGTESGMYKNKVSYQVKTTTNDSDLVASGVAENYVEFMKVDVKVGDVIFHYTINTTNIIDPNK